LIPETTGSEIPFAGLFGRAGQTRFFNHQNVYQQKTFYFKPATAQTPYLRGKSGVPSVPSMHPKPSNL